MSTASKTEKVACKEELEAVQETDETDEFTPALAAPIAKLWEDAEIQKTWLARFDTRIDIAESFSYFVQHLDRIAQPDYLQTADDTEFSSDQLKVMYTDIVHSDSRTSGVLTDIYNVDGQFFEIIDFGGQRSERRKWIRCFDHVSAVIFIAALTDYVKLAAEDDTSNRMIEAMKVFEEVAGNDHLKGAQMQLFLNKSDQFREVIKQHDIASVEEFKDYGGGSDFDAACDYFKTRFNDIFQKVRPDEPFEPFVTCATDASKFHVVIDNLKKGILVENLRKHGFDP